MPELVSNRCVTGSNDRRSLSSLPAGEVRPGFEDCDLLWNAIFDRMRVRFAMSAGFKGPQLIVKSPPRSDRSDDL